MASSSGNPCPIGWGGQFQPHFNDRVTVVNSAVAGRSVRTWLYDVQSTMDSTGECVLAKDASGNPTLQSHWQAMLTGMKAGDYLFIQFGINDTDSTCPRHVGVTAFEQTYAYMAKAAQDRGAQPVFVTPVSSISCSGSTAVPTRGTYTTATEQAGMQDGAPVIDLSGSASRSIISNPSARSRAAGTWAPAPAGPWARSSATTTPTFHLSERLRSPRS